MPMISPTKLTFMTAVCGVACLAGSAPVLAQTYSGTAAQAPNEFYGGSGSAPQVGTFTRTVQIPAEQISASQVSASQTSASQIFATQLASTGQQAPSFYYVPPTAFGGYGQSQPTGWTYQVPGQPIGSSYQTAPQQQPVAKAVTTNPVKTTSYSGFNSSSFASMVGGLRPYIAARAGATQFEDTLFKSGATDVTNAYDFGYGGSVAFGVRLGGTAEALGLRLEAELGAKTAEVEEHELVTGATTTTLKDDAAVGSANVQFAFANALADFGFGTGIGAFVGGGVGYGQIELKEHGADGSPALMDNKASTMGFQGILGLSFAFSQNMAIEGGYRYQRFNEVEFEAVDGTKSEVELSSSDVFAGVRFAF